ncbi:MAG TPA: hypothetical protein ENI23_12060 [bacterium]|nr:hypothetical protein [bacterium]
MKKSFLVYHDQKEVFDELSDDEAGKLIKAMLSYAVDGKCKQSSPLLNLVIIPIKQQMDRNKKKYEDTVKRRSEAGKIGGIASAKSRWGVNKSKQSLKSSTIVSKVTDKDKDKVKVIHKYNSLKSLTNEVVNDVAQHYSVNPKSVFLVRENLVGWCQAKGRVYKNYKAALQNWVRKEMQSGSIKKIEKAPDFDVPKISKEQRLKNIENIKEMKSKLLT